MIDSTEKIGGIRSRLFLATLGVLYIVLLPACTTIVTETPDGYDVHMKSPFTRTSTGAKVYSEPQAQNHVPYDNALEDEIGP